MRYIIYFIVCAVAFIGTVMYMPMREANQYALIQKQNGGIIVIEKNLNAINCGFKKKWVRNGHCVAMSTAKSWRVI